MFYNRLRLHSALGHLSPEDYERTRARLDANTKEAAQALADFDKSIELDPNDADAYYNRGRVHQKLGNFGRALEDFELALALIDDPGRRSTIERMIAEIEDRVD